MIESHNTTEKHVTAYHVRDVVSSFFNPGEQRRRDGSLSHK